MATDVSTGGGQRGGGSKGGGNKGGAKKGGGRQPISTKGSKSGGKVAKKGAAKRR